ncbi:MAG TPA: hypothetical protein VFU83_05620, partial [Pyrinomonadaceae bacterium]|nr:hypothetical protein [Pyrinomonadaceae bacterium]
MTKTLLSLCTLLSVSVSILGQQQLEPQSSLQDLVNRAAKTTLDRFADKKLTEDQLSITVIDVRNPQRPVTASFRGNERVYPASVVKLFYLVAAHRWL